MAKPALLLLVLCLVKIEGFLQDTTQQTRNNNLIRREFSNKNDYQRHTKFDRNFFGRSLERSLGVRQEAREHRDLKPEADSTMRRQLKLIEQRSRLSEIERRDRSSENRRSPDRNERSYDNYRRVISVSRESRRFTDRRLSNERQRDDIRRFLDRSTEDRTSVDRRMPMTYSTRRQQSELPVLNRRDRSTEDRRSVDRTLSNERRQDNSRKIPAGSSEDRRSINRRTSMADFTRRQPSELPVLDRRDRSTEDRRSLDRSLSNEIRQDNSRRALDRSTEDRRFVDRSSSKSDSRRRQLHELPVLDRRDRSAEDRRSSDRRLSNRRNQENSRRVISRSTEEDRTLSNERRQRETTRTMDRRSADRRVTNRDLTRHQERRTSDQQISITVLDSRDRSREDRRSVDSSMSDERRQTNTDRATQDRTSIENRRSTNGRRSNDRSMEYRRSLDSNLSNERRQTNTGRATQDRTSIENRRSTDGRWSNERSVEDRRSVSARGVLNQGNTRLDRTRSSDNAVTRNDNNLRQNRDKSSFERRELDLQIRQTRSFSRLDRTMSSRRFLENPEEFREHRLNTIRSSEDRQIHNQGNSRDIRKQVDNSRRFAESKRFVGTLETSRRTDESGNGLQALNNRQVSEQRIAGDRLARSADNRRQIRSAITGERRDTRTERLVASKQSEISRENRKSLPEFSDNRRNMRNVRQFEDQKIRSLNDEHQVNNRRQVSSSQPRFSDERRQASSITSRQAVPQKLEESRLASLENRRDTRHIRQTKDRQTRSSVIQRQIVNGRQARSLENRFVDSRRETRQEVEANSRLGSPDGRKLSGLQLPQNRRHVAAQTRVRSADTGRQIDVNRLVRSLDEEPLSSHRYETKTKSLGNSRQFQTLDNTDNFRAKLSENRRDSSIISPALDRRTEFRSSETGRISTERREIKGTTERRFSADKIANLHDNRQTRIRISRYVDDTEQHRVQSLEQRSSSGDENNNRLFSLEKLQDRVNTKTDAERRMATPFVYSNSKQIQNFQEVDYMPEIMKSTMWLDTAKILLFSLIVAQIFSSSVKSKRHNWFNNLTDFVSGVTKAKVL